MSQSGDAQSISYPALHDIDHRPPAAAFEEASAPIDPELLRMQTAHETKCAVCRSQEPVTTGAAYLVLSCQHKVHASCLAKIITMDKIDNRLGGTKVCQHCVELALRSGVSNAQNDPDLDFKECVKKMREKHIVSSGGVDTEKIMQHGLSDAILYTIMGEKPPPSAGAMWLSPKGILSLFSNNVEDDGSAAQSEDAPVSLPIGDELIAFLNSKNRTLDNILDTFKINAAHLFVAGIRSVEQLKKIGFDVKKHLQNGYRPVLPVYMLADSFELSYDEHLKGVVTPQELSTMKLTKRELRLLGVTMSKLIETNQCTKQIVFNFRIPPSDMMKYMGMEFVHFKILGFSARDFDGDEWKKDKKLHPQIAELVAQLATPKKKDK